MSYVYRADVMALFIGDDSVREFAERLAEGRRTAVHDAVNQALERELAREGDRAAERERRIRERGRGSSRERMWQRRCREHAPLIDLGRKLR